MQSETRAKVLGALQDDLEAIYRVSAPLPVGEVALDEAAWRRLGGDQLPEELMVVEADDAVEVGLYVDDAVLLELERPQTGWTHRRLQAHCRAVEGVSHFLYLTHCAQEGRQVSQLELELQAEVDKFATVLLSLWEAGRRQAVSELRQRLFERVSFHPHLEEEQRARYEKANFLARLYCRFLETRYVMHNQVEGLLSDLRRMYRMGTAEKLSYAACGTAW